MFKRKLEMRLVKDTKENPSGRLVSDEDTAAITNLVKQAVTYIVVGSIVAVVAGVTANVLGEIVVDKYTH